MSELDELSPEDLEKYRNDLAIYGTALTVRGDDGVLRYVPLTDFKPDFGKEKPRRGRPGRGK